LDDEGIANGKKRKIPNGIAFICLKLYKVKAVHN